MKILNTIRSRLEVDRTQQKDPSTEIQTKSKYEVVTGDSEAVEDNVVKKRSKLMESFLSWTLAIFVLSLVSWVYFTIIERKYYSSFGSEYFPGKAGSRIVMFMVVFYISIGFVSSICSAYKIYLPTPHFKLMRYVRIPLLNEHYSLLELLFVAILIFVQVASTMVAFSVKIKPDYEPPTKWYAMTKILGMAATYPMMILFFPVSKRSFWLELFNFKFERAVKIHKLLAGLVILFTLLHASFAFKALLMIGQFKACMWPSEECKHDAKVITYGWIAVAVTIPMMITSLPWFRRHKYEWFYYTHFLFIPFLILLQLHYDNFIYYIAPGLTAYILDKMLWWCSTRTPVNLVSLSCPVPGFVRIVLAVEPGYTCEPGQWVALNIPQISYLQYHPMSIACAPPTADNPTISFDLKVVGDWTKRLEQLAKQFDRMMLSHTRVFLDGFHGSSHMRANGYLQHSAALMVAGGIGVTPLMSSLRTIVASNQNSSLDFSHLKRIVFVWVVREEKMLELYREELSEIQSQSMILPDCEIEMHIHVTRTDDNCEEHDSAIFDTPRVPSPVLSTKFGEESSLLPNITPVSPFMKQLMGEGHYTELTVLAGVGFIFGLFLSKYATEGHSHMKYEQKQLLQAGLTTLCTIFFVAVGISISFLFSKKCNSKTPPKYYLVSPETSKQKGYNTDETKIESPLSSFSIDDSSEKPDLDYKTGCRPDLSLIFCSLREWCDKNGTIPSVGVGLCGPEGLVHDVIDKCNIISTSSVTFVADSEAFEW